MASELEYKPEPVQGVTLGTHFAADYQQQKPQQPKPEAGATPASSGSQPAATVQASGQPAASPFKSALQRRAEADRNLDRQQMQSQYDDWKGAVSSKFSAGQQEVVKGNQGVYARGFNLWQSAEDIAKNGKNDQNLYAFKEATMAFGATAGQNHGWKFLSGADDGTGRMSGFDGKQFNFYYKDKNGQLIERHMSMDQLRNQLEAKNYIDPNGRKADEERTRKEGIANRMKTDFDAYYNKDGKLTEQGLSRMQELIEDENTDRSYRSHLVTRYAQEVANQAVQTAVQQAQLETSRMIALEMQRMRGQTSENVAGIRAEGQVAAANARNGASANGASSEDKKAAAADALAALAGEQKPVIDKEALKPQKPAQQEGFLGSLPKLDTEAVRKAKEAEILAKYGNAEDPLAARDRNLAGVTAQIEKGDYIDRGLSRAGGGGTKEEQELADLRRRDASNTLTPGGLARLKELEGKALSADEKDSLRRLRGEPRQTQSSDDENVPASVREARARAQAARDAAAKSRSRATEVEAEANRLAHKNGLIGENETLINGKVKNREIGEVRDFEEQSSQAASSQEPDEYSDHNFVRMQRERMAMDNTPEAELMSANGIPAGLLEDKEVSEISRLMDAATGENATNEAQEKLDAYLSAIRESIPGREAEQRLAENAEFGSQSGANNYDELSSIEADRATERENAIRAEQERNREYESSRNERIARETEEANRALGYNADRPDTLRQIGDASIAIANMGRRADANIDRTARGMQAKYDNPFEKSFVAGKQLGLGAVKTIGQMATAPSRIIASEAERKRENARIENRNADYAAEARRKANEIRRVQLKAAQGYDLTDEEKATLKAARSAKTTRKTSRK